MNNLTTKREKKKELPDFFPRKKNIQKLWKKGLTMSFVCVCEDDEK